MSVLRKTLSDQRIISRPHHTTKYGRKSCLGKYCLCLRSLQCQERRPNSKARPDEAHSKACQAQTQPTRPRPPRPPPLQKLETIPRPRILVSRTKVTYLNVGCDSPHRFSGGSSTLHNSEFLVRYRRFTYGEFDIPPRHCEESASWPTWQSLSPQAVSGVQAPNYHFEKGPITNQSV